MKNRPNALGWVILAVLPLMAFRSYIPMGTYVLPDPHSRDGLWTIILLGLAFGFFGINSKE